MMDLRVLGHLDLTAAEETAGDPSGLLSQAKPTALFVHLLLARPGALHRRDALAAKIWPESDQKRSRGALSQTLYVIRRHLGGDVLASRGTEEVGIAAGAVRVDALEFQRLIEAGRTADALELYAGDLLASFYLPETPSFEHWLDAERARLRRAAAGAAWELAEAARGAGDERQAASWARRAVRIAPHDEAALRRLMLTLRELGDRAGALAEFDRYRKRLRGELELEPESETSALAAEIDAEGKRGEGPAAESRTVSGSSGDPWLAPPAGAGSRPKSLRRRLAGGAVAFVVIVSGFALANRALSPPSQDMARGREVPGVAVLPLAGEPRLSEQITRRLIETLQQTGLRTQGWLSVSRFAEGAAEPRLLGEQLGVS